MDRQRSAKPLHGGSNPPATSIFSLISYSYAGMAELGRRTGLKIPRGVKLREGSNPSPGTIYLTMSNRDDAYQ